MAGQNDLLKQAIELRKQRAAAHAQTIIVGEPEPAPAPVEEKVSDEPELTPQQKILKQATEAKKKALESNPSQKKVAKKKARDSKKVRDEKTAKKKAKKQAEKRAEEKKEKPVVKKAKPVEKPKRSTVAPTPVKRPPERKKVTTSAPVTVQFTGKLTPKSRAFAPTFRKAALEGFRSVSVGTDRAIVRNPISDGDPEQLIREKLQFVGINVSRVEKITASELNPDVSYRVFYG